MPYIDCTITIESERNVVYVEEGELGGAGKPRSRNKVSGDLKLDPLRLKIVERLNYWIKHDVRQQQEGSARNLLCTMDDIKTLGLALYQLLFSDSKIRIPFEESFKGVQLRAAEEPDLRLRLRLVFGPNTERLAALPWEFLLIAPNDNLDAGVFMAGRKTELLLIRRMQIPDIVYQLSPARTNGLCILLVICQPNEIDGKKYGDVDAKEIEEIRKTTESLSGQSPRVRVEPLTDPTYDELSSALETHKPQIVHYVGHGLEGKIALRKGEKEDDYDIQKEGKQFRWIPSEGVKSLFVDRSEKPRLVFLSACKGAAADVVEGFKSTARELIYAGIPGVVAMQYSITNNDAKLFAQKFYEAIRSGMDIDEAVKMGRIALSYYPPWHPRFAIPVVYLQSDEPFVSLDMVRSSEDAGTAEEVARGASVGARAARQSGKAAEAPTPLEQRERGRGQDKALLRDAELRR